MTDNSSHRASDNASRHGSSCDNSFDLVRWFFAISLLCFHYSRITDTEALLPVSGREIVSAFFVMAGHFGYTSYKGCVEAASTKASSATMLYLQRRCRRIVLPNLITITATAIICAPFAKQGISAYLTDTGTWLHLAANIPMLGFIAPTLPGVFANNPLQAVNGALWTMKVEVVYYLLLPLIWWLISRVMKRRFVITLVALWLTSILYYHVMLHMYEQSHSDIYLFLSRQLPGQMAYFALGMIGAHCKGLVIRHRYMLLAIGVAMCVALLLTGVKPVALHSLCMALLVVTCAYAMPRVLHRRLPDLSYEVYLVHFPIFQIVVALIGAEQIGADTRLRLCIFALSLAIIFATACTLRAVCRRIMPRR